MRNLDPMASRRRVGPYPLLLFCCAMILAFAGCTIEDAKAPSFTTTLIIPLGNHDMTVEDILDEQENLYVGQDDQIYFSVEGDTTEIDLDLDMEADLAATSVDANLGNFELPAVDPIGFSYSLADLNPAVAALPPGTYAIPAYDFSLDGDPNDVPNIGSATIESGTISAELTNGMPFPVSGDSPPQELRADIFDSLTDNLVISIPFTGEIASGETRTETADLAGKTLPGSLYVTLVGGWGATTVTDPDPAAEIAVWVSMDNLVVESASAVVEAQSFSQSSVTDLPSDMQIIEATIQSGGLAMTFDNNLPIPSVMTLTFDEIFMPGGAALSEVINIPAASVVNHTIDLAGATIHDPADDGSALTTLSYHINVESPGSDGAEVVIGNDARLRADIAASTLTFAEVTGLFEEQTFELDPIEEEIDLPDELDGLTLAEATITIEIENGTGVDGEIEFILSGTDASGDPAPTVSETIPITANGHTTASITDGLAELLSALPEIFTFEGNVVVGGPGRPGTIRPGDTAMVTWTIDAPVRMSLSNSVIDTDPEFIDMDEDERDDTRKYLIEAEFIMDIENHFPFGMDIQFQVGTDSLSTINGPYTIIAQASVEAGIVDAATGFVSDPVTTRSEIVIGETEINALTQPNAWTAMVATIPGTDGEIVGLKVSDYLRASGAVSVEILVEEDEE